MPDLITASDLTLTAAGLFAVLVVAIACAVLFAKPERPNPPLDVDLW